MKIQYPEYGSGKEQTRVISIEEFAYQQLLTQDGNLCRDSVRLENQPAKVCAALGRLLNILLERHLLTELDLHEVLKTEWDMQRRAVLVPDPAEEH